jgi:hypothetical protein
MEMAESLLGVMLGVLAWLEDERLREVVLGSVLVDLCGKVAVGLGARVKGVLLSGLFRVRSWL